MTDAYMSERTAMRMLVSQGDFAEGQARIVLAHSRRQVFDGVNYYPIAYVHRRAAENAAKAEPDAWSVVND